MSGDIEIGICNICGQHTQVSRRYYHYDVKCNCCNGKHFEIVKYCEECEPNPPKIV